MNLNNDTLYRKNLKIYKGGRSSFHSVTGIPVLKFQKEEGGSVLLKGLNACIFF